jgi:hypothetical protein
MTTEETIERLTLEIEELQGKMAEASRLAAHDDIAGHGDPLSAARELLEHRELLKLKRIALAQAKQIAEQEVIEATRVERERVRDEICSLTDELESEATKMRNGIKRLGKNFKRIVEIEKEIKGLGQNAADWPVEVFRYRSPGESPYRYLINSLTVELDLNGFHINGWPNQYQASQLADIAECFRDYLYQREEWRHRFDEVIEETNHA